MGFIKDAFRGICDIATAPLKAVGQAVTGLGKGIGALAQGDIGGFFGETFKGLGKAGGEIVHGTLSGIKGLAGPVLTVAGGLAGGLVGGIGGLICGGPLGLFTGAAGAIAGAGLGASLGNKLGNAIGGAAGGMDNAVANGLGLYGYEGGQQACGQQNYNDFGCGYNSSYPSYGCGNQLPYSFYQGAQGYPNCQPQWCPPPCGYRPPYYNAAPGNCCCW